MAEEFERLKQFEYKATSNLVLNIAERKRETGPSSEVSSLIEKYQPNELQRMFGDRVSRARPKDFEKRVEKARRKRQGEQQGGATAATAATSATGEQDAERRRRKKLDPALASVLTADVDQVYRPTTRETRLAYEALLNFIQSELPDKPHDVLRSAADEVLAVLKTDGMKDMDKKKEIEGLFHRSASPMDADRFAQLFNMGQRITDYRSEEREGGEEKLDEDVPIVFGDEEEEAEEDVDEVKEGDESAGEEDEEEGTEAQLDFRIETRHDAEEEGDLEEKDKDALPAHSIDAFWLQRRLGEYYRDPLASQKMAESVMQCLSSDQEDRVCENELVLLLDYDKFDLVKVLLKNRRKIVYCTRLARAADAEERARIEQEMKSNPLLVAILEELHHTSTAEEKGMDMERKLVSEARQLTRRKQQQEALGEADMELVVDKGTIEADRAAAASGASAASSGETALGVGASKARAIAREAAEPFWTLRPRSNVDLDALAFSREGHFMSNKECKLPANSQVINRKGYQEVHIPALAPRPFAADERLVNIRNDLPAWTHNAFMYKDAEDKEQLMNNLNRIQSRVHKMALESSENMLICAPTGSGKTNCAMLTILREIGTYLRPDGTVRPDAFKVIYVAPMKSLVREMVLNFGQRLGKYGVQVKELSGDQQLTKQQIDETQIIVTTPEKWDIVTRKSGDRTYTQLVRLVIIDEIHLLHDSRGPVLESIVARTIRQVESTQEAVRLVGLSATLPNYKDVALLLRVDPDRGLFVFDNSFRPVPLEQQFVGVTQKKAFRRMELMNQICYEKVMDNAGKNQMIVFVHSRKETANTAKMIRDKAMEEDQLGKFVDEESGMVELLKEEAGKARHPELKELLPYGFAIHHAGMHKDDRARVEDLFAAGFVQVLVSTATLAWGVNLPARTVIIKGTQIYSPEKGAWTELSHLDILQMMGRAGRPQYDKQGTGILITTHSELHYYLSLQNEQLPVESQFIKMLADNLNAEVVLGTVQSVREAVTWLGYTYLYVRMLRRPDLYGVSPDALDEDPYLEQRRVDLIHSAASLLDKHGLLKYDRKTGAFQVTDLGRVASHYYITHQSMSLFNEYLKPTLSDIELYRVFSLSSEFKYMAVREEEKIELARLRDKVPIPIKEGIEEPSAKVNVLLQAYISRLKMEGFALVSDMVYITQSAGRVMRAIFEVALKRGWAAVAEKALTLCKEIDHRMWAAQSPLRQFSGIPQDVIKRIEGKDFAWERLYDLEEHAIGELVRVPKMGKVIHRAVHQLPRLELQGQVQPITHTMLRVELTITPDFEFDPKVHGQAEPFWIWVEDVDSEYILHYEHFVLKQSYSQDEHVVSFTIPIQSPLPPQYYVRVVSDRWLGSVAVLPISFRHLILPERFPPPTELLDLQPRPLEELASEPLIRLYASRFREFNPIQTQVFDAIYRGDQNALVLAPTGSGKTVLAELAVFRALSQAKGQGVPARCVYIAPLESLARERYTDWRARLESLGIRITKLTGDSNADLKLLAEGQVVIATPEQWDIMSRRWTTRKNVQSLSLFLVDEVHLIGGEVGPVLEVIVSRMRYIAQQTKNKTRIVCLGSPVANAHDLADWIGATSAAFSFHPVVRPVPLEIRVQGFDIHSFRARQLAMTKPCYTHIKRHSTDKPVIVFAPSRKLAQQAAADIVAFCVSEGEAAPAFLHITEQALESFAEGMRDKALQLMLRRGVAYYHEGLAERDRKIVEDLFETGAVQVLVSEQTLCWGMRMQAHLVVILGTQYYDGREHRYVDRPITDILQMMGRACRPGVDAQGKVTLFCHAPRKELYKKFLYEPFPVESHLDSALADHLNAEIVTKRVTTVQDCVDWLTWTFYFRRLTQNPNYYNLQGRSHRHVSDFLSELVENTLADLAQSQCISIEDETDLSPLNLGMIAAYYYIRYTTVELFNSSLRASTKLKGLLEILSHASEFDSVPVRYREDVALRKLAQHLPLAISNAGSYSDPHIKTNVLLQAHFSRVPLTAAVAGDQETVLPEAVRLLQAIVDVLSSKGWLKPALASMELTQMMVQGIWSTDSPLLQLPHITKDMAEVLKREAAVETVFDLLEMDDELRNRLLQVSPQKMAEIAHACNKYPNIEVSYHVVKPEGVKKGAQVQVSVDLERDEGEEDEEENTSGDDEDDKRRSARDRKQKRARVEKPPPTVPVVAAPRYPQIRNEGWWLVVGDARANEILSIKRATIRGKSSNVVLEFEAPSAGKHTLTLYLMSDSYLGCDQEYELSLQVEEGEASEGEEEGSEMEDGEAADKK